MLAPNHEQKPNTSHLCDQIFLFFVASIDDLLTVN
jgi:hypothetical protein